MSDFNKTITPNPKALASLRSAGYSTYSALCDLIDNSIDAKVPERPLNVSMDFRNAPNSRSIKSIVLCDNGSGMTSEILNEALRLGSNTPKEESSDLGWFGMGLVTASISQGRRVTVHTRADGHDLVTATMDLDFIEKSGRYELLEFRKATQEEFNTFEKHVGSTSGTMVSLSKLDKISNKDKYATENKIISDAGRIYRKFLSTEGYNLSVCGKEVNPFDPLYFGEKETEVLFDAPIEVSGKNLCYTRLAIIPAQPAGGAADIRGIRNQGFSVLRNNREILFGDELDGIWGQKHGSATRLRGEISFSGDVSALFGVDFQKQSLRLSQSSKDAIHDSLKRVLRLGKNKLVSSGRKSEVEERDSLTRKIEQEIAQKRKLLENPIVPNETRASPEKGAGSRKKSDNPAPRTRRFENAKEGVPSNARIEFASMTPFGPLFDSTIDGSISVLVLNQDHPFIEVLLGANDREFGAVLKLLFACAQADLKYALEDDEKAMVLEGFKLTLSHNLKVLLS